MCVCAYELYLPTKWQDCTVQLLVVAELSDCSSGCVRRVLTESSAFWIAIWEASSSSNFANVSAPSNDCTAD